MLGALAQYEKAQCGQSHHSTGLQFDDIVNRSLETLYQTRDAARRREAVLEAVQLQSGKRVLGIGAGPGFLAAEYG